MAILLWLITLPWLLPVWQQLVHSSQMLTLQPALFQNVLLPHLIAQQQFQLHMPVSWLWAQEQHTMWLSVKLTSQDTPRPHSAWLARPTRTLSASARWQTPSPIPSISSRPWTVQPTLSPVPVKCWRTTTVPAAIMPWLSMNRQLQPSHWISPRISVCSPTHNRHFVVTSPLACLLIKDAVVQLTQESWALLEKY